MYVDPHEEPGHLLAGIFTDDVHYMLIEANSFLVGQKWKDRCHEVALSNPEVLNETVGIGERHTQGLGTIMQGIFSRPCKKCRGAS